MSYIANPEFYDSCFVYRTAVQSLSDKTWTSLNLNLEVFDNNSMHDTVTNNDRITVQAGRGGLYEVACLVIFAANTTGARLIRLRVNATTTLFLGSQDALQYAGVGNTLWSPSYYYEMAAADYFTVEGWQDIGGGALNVTGAYLWCLGPLPI